MVDRYYRLVHKCTCIIYLFQYSGSCLITKGTKIYRPTFMSCGMTTSGNYVCTYMYLSVIKVKRILFGDWKQNQ